MITNKYKLKINNLGYINSFETTLGNEYDYLGQMSQYPDACKGWTKFVDGKFVEDETKKAEILAKEEADRIAQEKENQRLEAQITYTALMTDSLLEE
jgi:hypothetical protein